ADPHTAHHLLVRAVQTQAAAEDVDAPDPAPDHRVVRGTVRRGRPLVRRGGIDRIAVLQPVEAAPGLRGRVEVGRGEGETVLLSGPVAERTLVEAGGVGGAGL